MVWGTVTLREFEQFSISFLDFFCAVSSHYRPLSPDFLGLWGSDRSPIDGISKKMAEHIHQDQNHWVTAESGAY